MVLQQAADGDYKVIAIDSAGLGLAARSLPDRFAVVVNGLDGRPSLRFDYSLDQSKPSDGDFTWTKAKAGQMQADWRQTGSNRLPDLQAHVWSVKATGDEAGRVQVNNSIAEAEQVTLKGIDTSSCSIVGIDCCDSHCGILTQQDGKTFVVYVTDNNWKVLNSSKIEAREGSRGFRGVRAISTGDPNTLMVVVIEDTSRQLTDTLVVSLNVTRDGGNWTVATGMSGIYYQL